MSQDVGRGLGPRGHRLHLHVGEAPGQHGVVDIPEDVSSWPSSWLIWPPWSEPRPIWVELTSLPPCGGWSEARIHRAGSAWPNLGPRSGPPTLGSRSVRRGTVRADRRQLAGKFSQPLQLGSPAITGRSGWWTTAGMKLVGSANRSAPACSASPQPSFEEISPIVGPVVRAGESAPSRSGQPGVFSVLPTWVLFSAPRRWPSPCPRPAQAPEAWKILGRVQPVALGGWSGAAQPGWPWTPFSWVVVNPLADLCVRGPSEARRSSSPRRELGRGELADLVEL